MVSPHTRSTILRALLYGGLGAAFALLAIGIPTDIVPNPIFGRPLVGVRLQDYVFLGITALLAGVLAASYAVPQTRVCSNEQGKTTLGGLFTLLAVGCPTCNKLVVLLLGTSGALNVFQPLQPLLGLLSLGLLAVAVWVRWRPVVQPSAVGRQPSANP